MKKYVLLSFVFAILGCAGTAQDRIPIRPKTPLDLRGAEVYSPGESGWIMFYRDSKSVMYGKRLESTLDSALVSVVIDKIIEFGVSKKFDSDSELLSHIGQLLQRELPGERNRFKRIYFNSENILIKNTACLKYKGLSEDHKHSGIDSINFQYLGVYGYYCIHPFNKKYMSKIEISYRSKDKEFPGNLLSIGEEFFSNVNYTESGL